MCFKKGLTGFAFISSQIQYGGFYINVVYSRLREENRRSHSAKGKVPYVAERKKHIVSVVE